MQTLMRLKPKLKKLLPAQLRRMIWTVAGRHNTPPTGTLRFGDLKRTSPISSQFGFDRGTPIDRYYIERFLAGQAGYIQGRVLEIGDNEYTTRFGGKRVTRSDILHVDSSNTKATIVADLESEEALQDGAFDCIVLTQTP